MLWSSAPAARRRTGSWTSPAPALAAIHGAVTADTETSCTRDTGPAAAAGLDYGLSQLALIAVSSRADVVAKLDHPPPRHARPQRPPGPRHRNGAGRGPPDRPHRPAATARRSAGGPGRRRAARRRRPLRRHPRDRGADARSRPGLPFRHRGRRRPGAAVRADRPAPSNTGSLLAATRCPATAAPCRAPCCRRCSWRWSPGAVGRSPGCSAAFAWGRRHASAVRWHLQNVTQTAYRGLAVEHQRRRCRRSAGTA